MECLYYLPEVVERKKAFGRKSPHLSVYMPDMRGDWDLSRWRVGAFTCGAGVQTSTLCQTVSIPTATAPMKIQPSWAQSRNLPRGQTPSGLHWLITESASRSFISRLDLILRSYTPAFGWYAGSSSNQSSMLRTLLMAAEVQQLTSLVRWHRGVLTYGIASLQQGRGYAGEVDTIVHARQRKAYKDSLTVLRKQWDRENKEKVALQEKAAKAEA